MALNRRDPKNSLRQRIPSRWQFSAVLKIDSWSFKLKSFVLSSGFSFRSPKIRKRTFWRFTRPGTCWPPTPKSWTSGFLSRRTTSLMGTTSTWTSYHIRSASRITSCTQSQTTSPTPSPRASRTSSSSLTGTPSSLLPQGTELWVWWFWVTLHGVKKDFQLFKCKSFTTQVVKNTCFV